MLFRESMPISDAGLAKYLAVLHFWFINKIVILKMCIRDSNHIDRLSVYTQGNEQVAAVVIVSGNIGNCACDRGKMFKIHKKMSFFYCSLMYHMPVT